MNFKKLFVLSKIEMNLKKANKFFLHILYQYLK